ncbi:MAG: TonB-dependent receptor plug domain-containing protein [Gammaproteobacteria bacterium]|nr:TonB-dependent receptor plug domain-containing protein [Gammaproteobacteria bacterium]
MRHESSIRVTAAKGITPVRTAVCIALYGVAQSAYAQQASPDALQEVTVTATRHNQTLEAVPYNLSVVSAEQIAQAGVTDMASLATEVPGLSMYEYGARDAGATVPIIRGINATGEPTRGFRTFEQAPVGTYVGNSPIDGYFQLDDLQRVEVLRGPQGTLYGAGALGGAIRLIPNSPQLNKFAGTVEASGGYVDHSSGTPYTVKGMFNLPLGSTLAFRTSAKYAYEPGWIDTYGLLERSNNGLSGIPTLANPAAPVTSPPVYQDRKDWNFQKSFTGRASLLWQPTEAFSAEAAILDSSVQGDGGPQVNLNFPGGTSPLDPASQLPAGGAYREFSQIDAPFSRYTNLASLDLSYDAGFATVSATSSYYTTSGKLLQDNTYSLGGLAGGFYLLYYAGVPTNPRFIYDQSFTDSAHTFTQEVRLVSKAGPDNVFDYVLGGFYESQRRLGAWSIAVPGTPERQAAQGCPCAGVWEVGVAPGDVTFQQVDTQFFTDKSVFGELTWHFVHGGQITAGVRHFSQSFDDEQSYDDYNFPTHLPATPHESPASKTVGKVNPSFEYAKDQYVYALWSQGFRRGGANSVPLTGPFRESPLLSIYAPDSTNNYEAGLKGRFGNGLSYTVAVFDIKWDRPQIASSLPSGNLAVYNGNTAESKGFELESTGPLFVPHLIYNVSYAYADAHLTSGFSLPANNGAQTGTIVPGLITGTSGEQMPGSPKSSASAALLYDMAVSDGYDLTLGVNGVYRSKVPMQLAATLGVVNPQESSTYEIMNLSAALSHQAWRATLYMTNVFDKENILVPPTQFNELGKLTNDYIVNPPREIGIRVAFTF